MSKIIKAHYARRLDDSSVEACDFSWDGAKPSPMKLRILEMVYSREDG